MGTSLLSGNPHGHINFPKVSKTFAVHEIRPITLTVIRRGAGTNCWHEPLPLLSYRQQGMGRALPLWHVYALSLTGSFRNKGYRKKASQREFPNK